MKFIEIVEIQLETLKNVDFILLKAEAPPVVKNLVHSDDPHLERIDALLPPQEKDPSLSI